MTSYPTNTSCPETSNAKKREGLSSELDTALNHLRRLVDYLPESVPLAKTGSIRYDFGLDDEDVRDEGVGYALNWRLEIVFETHNLPKGGVLQLKERGPHWKQLVSFPRDTAKKLTVGDCEFVVGCWVQRIIEGAQAAGAKIPNKKFVISNSKLAHNEIICRRAISVEPPPGSKKKCTESESITILSDDENHANENAAPAAKLPMSLTAATATPQLVVENISQKSLRQSTLFEFGKRATMAEVMEQQKAISEKYGRDPEVVQKQKRREGEERQLRKQDQNRKRQQHFRDRKKAAKSGGKKAKEDALGHSESMESMESLTTTDIAEFSH